MAENKETAVALTDLSPTPDVAIPLDDDDDDISEYSTLTMPMEVKFQDSITSSRADSICMEPNKPKIPDGGWGWVIVIASLIISLIQDGISFSFGILYPKFTEEFEAPAAVISWIGSLFLSVPLLTGPMMSALVDKYGCRAMTIVGGIVSASGFFLAGFARSVAMMYLTFGIITGLGLGLTYITAVVSIAFWFDKKRNLAVGLGACGTGIGTFVYAPFTTILVNHFGWRWSVVILGATLLLMCICGFLMRDPDWIKEENKQHHKSSRSSKSSSLSIVSTQSDKINLDDIRNLLKDGKDAEFVLQTLVTSIEHEEKGPKSEHHQSVLNLPTFIKQNEKVPIEVLEHLSENKKIYKVIVQNYPSLLHCRSTSEKGLNKLVEDASLIQRIPVTFSLKVKKTQKPKTLTHQYSLPENPSAVTEPLISNEKKAKAVKITPNVDKTDTTPWLVKQFSTTNPHQNYFKNMRFPRHSLIHRGAVLNKNKYRLRTSSCPNIYRVSMTTIMKEEDERWYTAFSNFIKELFDFSLFLEFHFFLLSLSTIILFAWFMTPYFYLTDHMESANYTTSQASYVMSAMGATNTLGMVILGWAGDQPWTNVIKTYGICMILCGICCSGMIIFTHSYGLLMTSAGLYGIFLAGNFSFTPIILVELLPLETFTKAYGLQLLCEGIGHLGGPPFAGFLYDITLTYDLSFHLAAAWIIVSGLLVLVIPYTKNRKIIGSGPVESELANA